MADLFPQQNKISFPQTLAAAQKFPVIGNRIFATLAKAQEYVDKVKGSAIPGIYLSVISDGDNNGAYWVAQAAGYEGATVGILQKMDVGGGGGSGITSIDFTLESDTTNAITLKINDTSKTIAAATLKTSLGLKELAYQDSLALSDLANISSSAGDGLVYNSGKYSLATSGVIAGTYPKVTVDKYGRVTFGASLVASDIPSLTMAKISDLAGEFSKYVLQTTYDTDINGETNGLAARLANLEKMFSFDGEGNIKTIYNFYSTKQVSSGGKAGSTTSLVTVEPALTSGTLVATINGTKIYAPEASGGEVTLASLATALNGGNLEAAITFAGNDSYGIFTATDNYCSIGSSEKRFYRAYFRNLYIGTSTSPFSGKTTSISSSSTDNQIPSAKSVYTFVNNAISGLGSGLWYAEDDTDITTDYANTVVNNLYVSGFARLSQIYAPTTSGGSSYGIGSNGQVLKSNGSTVYWADESGGGGSSYTLPLASSTERGGIKIGFSEYGLGGQYYDMPLLINNEAAYVRMTSGMIATALGYSPANPNSLPVATSNTVGGIKIGFTATSSSGSYYNIPVQLSSNKAYVQLTKAMITTALGFTPSEESPSTSSGGGVQQSLSLNNINGQSMVLLNGVYTAVVTASATLNLRSVTPLDVNTTCVIHIIKAASCALTIPILSTSGVRVISSTGTASTSATNIAGLAGITLVWNPSISKWDAQL